MDYVVTLTETENMALAFAAADQNEWIQNAIHERCRIAIEDIVTITVQKCLETGVQIPGSKEEMVALAFEKQWVKTVVQSNQERLAADAASAPKLVQEPTPI